jgi:hypothetical protein
MTTDDAIIPTELRHGPWAAFARKGPSKGMIVDVPGSDDSQCRHHYGRE